MGNETCSSPWVLQHPGACPRRGLPWKWVPSHKWISVMREKRKSYPVLPALTDPSGMRLAHAMGEQALMAPLLQVLLETLEAGFPCRMSCQMSFSALFPVSPLHHITRHIHSGVTAPSNQRSRAFAASLAGGAVPGSLHGVCSLISRFWGNSSSTKSAHSFPNV